MTSYAIDGTVNQALGSVVTTPRNLLDCSDFGTNPWQIATSFNGNGPGTSTLCDRWVANSGTSLVWTAGRASNITVQGFTAALQWGRSVGDTHTVGLSVGQVMETAKSIRAQGQPISLSFWNVADANFAAGASGGTFIASIVSGTGLDEAANKMFSGAWSGMTTVATSTITPGTSIARIGPITGTVPTGATQLGLAFSYVATTAATSPGLTAGTHESLQFMGVQLEIGNNASSYERQDQAQVTQTAMRYLQVIPEPTTGTVVGTGIISSGNLAIVSVPLVSPMRKAPTLTMTAGTLSLENQLLTDHVVTSGTLIGAQANAVTIKISAATGTLTAGQACFLTGRSTNGGGIVILNSDY